MRARPIGFDCGGIWKPHSINPVLRVTEYSPGQLFKPHFDVRDGHRDMIVVVVAMLFGGKGKCVEARALVTALHGFLCMTDACRLFV